MADTIVNTPERDTSGGAVWAVAIVAIVLILAGAFIWYQRNAMAVQQPNQQAPGANINVTLPTGGTSDNTNNGQPPGTQSTQ